MGIGETKRIWVKEASDDILNVLAAVEDNAVPTEFIRFVLIWAIAFKDLLDKLMESGV